MKNDLPNDHLRKEQYWYTFVVVLGSQRFKFQKLQIGGCCNGRKSKKGDTSF